MSFRVAVIGAGAAGAFCAIEVKRRHPDAEVHVFEKGTRAMAKLAVTGGGRCNLTNSFRGIDNLLQAYPRGDKLMRRMLVLFSHEDLMAWFEREGVALTVQDDECVFPVSQDAMEIVGTLSRLMQQQGVRLHLRQNIDEIGVFGEQKYILFREKTPVCSGEDNPFDRVVVTTGGNTFHRIVENSSLDIEMVPAVPSLFTFNLADRYHAALMGTVVQDVTASLAGTKFRARGAFLWTHWGASGPAVLKLSSYGARHLAEHSYQGTMVVNWCVEKKEEEVRSMLSELFAANAQRSISNIHPAFLTSKQWDTMLEQCAIPVTQRCGALNKTHLNRLLSILTAQQLPITGRCHYKEEFVTCGGVALSNISMKTLESKRYPGLFFAGEVLDVDAVTGGFNLQAAWSMAYCVAENM